MKNYENATYYVGLGKKPDDVKTGDLDYNQIEPVGFQSCTNSFVADGEKLPFVMPLTEVSLSEAADDENYMVLDFEVNSSDLITVNEDEKEEVNLVLVFRKFNDIDEIECIGLFTPDEALVIDRNEDITFPISVDISKEDL